MKKKLHHKVLEKAEHDDDFGAHWFSNHIKKKQTDYLKGSNIISYDQQDLLFVDSAHS